MKHIVSIGLLAFCVPLGAQNPLFIPDTLAGPNYSLTMHRDSVQFFPGAVSHTYAFNANHYLGPTLLLNKGANVSITVNNQVGDTTTVHWHGLHVPAVWDGGPYSVILPNASWNPQFTVMNDAATFWYHPHPDMKTAEQAIKGAAGLIIVRDNAEAALTLPRKYGIDDFPLVVQCQQYDSLNQAMPRGMEDSTLLVNGTMNPFLDVPAQVIRFRLLNASGERTFNFGFTNSMSFYVIGSDGGLLSAPYATTRIRLAPGERAEVLLNLSGMNGQSFHLMSYASELPMGTQGGPTMPMPPWSPPMNSPLNGIDFDIMQVNVVAQTANPVTTIPSSLVPVNPWPVAQVNAQRKIHFTADSAMVMDGPFYFNDSTFDMMRIDYTILLNSIETWTLVNQTMVAHPFHLHDVQFYIIDRNGLPPTPEEASQKDVVLVQPNDSVTFITKFTDFADTTMPYMFHCHILMHEDDGMMGQFVVSPYAVGIHTTDFATDGFLIYPNPASEAFTIHAQSGWAGPAAQVAVYDACGKEIIRDEMTGPELKLCTEKWHAGFYTLVITRGKKTTHRKIIVYHTD